MIELAWLVETLGYSLHSSERALDILTAYAGRAGVRTSGDLTTEEAFALLDAIKAGEPGLAAVAASTLKVRIMMLLPARGRLAASALRAEVH